MKPLSLQSSYEPQPHAHDHEDVEHELLLAVERAGRRNRRSSRDRLHWDRELYDAYLRSGAANDDGLDPEPDHSDAA